MKALLKKIDEWAAKAITFIRPRKHKSPNVLTDEVHLKETSDFNIEKEWKREKVFTSQEYYATREGQIMRKPEKKKYYYLPGFKFIKRSKKN